MTESTTPTPAAVARDDDDTPEPEYIIADACEEWVRTEQTGKDLLLLQSESYELGLTVRRALSADGYTIAGPGQSTTGRKMIALDYECGMILSEYLSHGGGQIRAEEIGGAICHLKTVLASQDAKGAS